MRPVQKEVDRLAKTLIDVHNGAGRNMEGILDGMNSGTRRDARYLRQRVNECLTGHDAKCRCFDGLAEKLGA